MLKYAKLEMRFISDRGARYADILIPGQPTKFINMASLAERLGFAAKSRDAIINLHDFFVHHESYLVKPGEALAASKIPAEVADLIIDHKIGTTTELRPAS